MVVIAMSNINCIEKPYGVCVAENGSLIQTTAEERIRFIKRISLFSSLSEEQLSKIAGLVRDRCFPDGDYICRKGEAGLSSFIIFEGEVEVHKEAHAKDLIYTAREGEVIGEMSVLADIPRTASLRARGNAHLLEILGADFIDLLHKNPDLSVKLLRLLVRRLAD